MQTTSSNKPVLKAKCSLCGHKIITQEFTIERMSWVKGGRHIFQCNGCGAKVTMSPKFYKLMNIFIYYFILIVVAGGISAIFAKEPMHVTFAMVMACLAFIPLIVLTALNKKAVPLHDT